MNVIKILNKNGEILKDVEADSLIGAALSDASLSDANLINMNTYRNAPGHPTRRSTNYDKIGIIGLFVGIVFVGLKSSGHVDWSLWFVTLPFWVAILPGVFSGLVMFIYTKLIQLLDKRWEMK